MIHVGTSTLSRLHRALMGKGMKRRTRIENVGSFFSIRVSYLFWPEQNRSKCVSTRFGWREREYSKSGLNPLFICYKAVAEAMYGP